MSSCRSQTETKNKKNFSALFHSTPGAEERSPNAALDIKPQKVQRGTQKCTFQCKVYLGFPGKIIKRGEKHQTGGAGSARPLFSSILRKGEYKHKRKFFRGLWRIY